jgi:2-polyprenyl-3-methyl-5-hydroxy-6-metoxy-1,4-benzoquinol methylase
MESSTARTPTASEADEGPQQVNQAKVKRRRARTPWYEPPAFAYGGQLSLATIDPDDSHGKMLGMITPGSRVLETGCANGRFTAVLAEIKCQVVGVELDPQAALSAARFCEEVIVGNLESEETIAQIPGGFDIILFGDVLEHLVRPWQVLRSMQSKLNPNGCLVVSIPNVAHWDVRMGLLRGRFDYQQNGLLDSTHLRFFTRYTAHELLKESGYRIVKTDDTLRLPSWVYSIRIVRRFAPRLLPMLCRIAPNLFTYQFVLKAVPINTSR